MLYAEQQMSDSKTQLEVGSDCHGCGVCLEACDQGAISMDESGDDPVAAIDASKCNLCRACMDICPAEAILEPYPPAWRDQ